MSAPPAPDDAPRVPLRDRVASAAFMALIRLFRLRCVLDATGTALKRYGAPRRLTPP